MAPFAVTPDDFARHMDLLVERSYRCLTISQLVDELRSPFLKRSDEKIAAITFDDGYADFVSHTLPVLQQRNLTATMYLTSGWLDGGTTEISTRPDDKFLDWSQVPNLVEAGIEVGAHSHTHPQMDTLDNAEAVYELMRSKALIEDAVGSGIRSFAYPHGYSSPKVRQLTAQSGYDSAAAVVICSLMTPMTDFVSLA